MSSPRLLNVLGCITEKVDLLGCLVVHICSEHELIELLSSPLFHSLKKQKLGAEVDCVFCPQHLPLIQVGSIAAKFDLKLYLEPIDQKYKLHSRDFLFDSRKCISPDFLHR